MTILDKLLTAPRVRQTAARLIEDAKLEDDERRKQGRHPYFHPVTIQLKESPELYSAFSRDVSITGIGLLHWMPIPPQIIRVVLTPPNSPTLRVRVKISWCSAWGEGWYISGGRYLEVESD
jgi:hypothetical protein